MQVSYIGMQTQEVAIKPTMKVFMKVDSEMLDEVIVVAYGTAKKSAFTGSASVVKADKLEKRQVSNITNALSGSVAGVQTTSSNGQPGTSATVRIRGIGSMASSSNPLYVVDGIPFDGDISSINSQDIETMTVLKDAAAAALYGARGANGVILVTTKKGKDGNARVSVDARWGSNSRQVGKYDVMENPDTWRLSIRLITMPLITNWDVPQKQRTLMLIHSCSRQSVTKYIHYLKVRGLSVWMVKSIQMRSWAIVTDNITILRMIGQMERSPVKCVKSIT